MSDASTAISQPSTPPEKRVALETLSIKRRTTNEKAVARSRLIRRMRIILPVLAVVLVVALFQNMKSDGPDEAFLDDFTLDVTPDQYEMANPRFTGVDGSGKPFEIIADAATRTPDEEDALTLSNPKAVTQGADAKTVVVAEEGLFQSEKKILELDKDVTLEHTVGDDFYTLKTDAATVLIDEKIVHTDKGVVGDGPGGDELQADKMTAYQDEDRVVFEGNVRLKVYQSADKTAPSGLPSIRKPRSLTPNSAPERLVEGTNADDESQERAAP